MKLFITTILSWGIIAHSITAQAPSQPSFSRLSFEVNAGMVSSKKKIARILLCDLCSNYTYQIEGDLLEYVGSMLNYRLNGKNQLGFGVAKTKQGYTINPNEPYDYRNQQFVFTYASFRLRHQLVLKRWNFMELKLANALELDRITALNYKYWILNPDDIKKTGLSHMAEMVVGVHFLRRMELTTSMVARTALTTYSDRAYEGDLHRFGFGFLCGLSYRI